MKIPGRALVILVSMLALDHAFAQSLPSAHIKVQRLEEVFQFKSSDQLIADVLLVREALSAQGAQILTKQVVGINTSLEKLELLEAFTQKKSGEKILLSKDAIVVQRGYVSPGVGVTIPEWEAHQWTFPSIEVGDATVVHYKKTSIRPPFAGWQSASDFLMPAVDFDKVVWRIEAPQGLGLSVKSSLAPTLSTTQSGTSIWQFEASQKAQVLDPNPSSIRQAFHYLMASTVTDHQAIAVSFATAVAEKATLTAEVKALALKLTEGLSTDAQKAKALYDWVRKDIKYTALYLGNDGWEPHDVTHILQKRYGDCKDHVTLLYALLASTGIESQPVLINIADEYVADPLPVSGSYNHTILYLPSLQRYVDPTAANIPFEALPFSDTGKPVVRSDGRTATVDRTPAISAQTNSVKVKTSLAVAADGSAKGAIEIQSTGAEATQMQDRLEQIPLGFSGAAIQKILRSSNYEGTGFLKFDKITRDVLKQTVNAEVDIKDLLREPAAGSVQTHPGVNLPIYIRSKIGNYTPAKRELAYVCSSYSAMEEFEISYDNKYQLSRIPADTKISIDGVQFSATYKFANNVLTGKREMLVEHASQECTPQEYSRRKATMEKISSHLRAPMLYIQ